MDEIQEAFVQLLKEELVPAVGCTEPSAIALCAAKAAQVLGGIPQRVKLTVSGNIVKNAKSVIVPNTNGMTGIKAAATAGIIVGHPELELEVLKDVTDEQKKAIDDFIREHEIDVHLSESDRVFEICTEVFLGEESAKVVITDAHTNIVKIEKNGCVLFEKQICGGDLASGENTVVCLSVESIVAFVNSVELNAIAGLIERQIQCNCQVSKMGLAAEWGANVGRTLLACYDSSDVRIRAKARAAAGSDARMSGCIMPVVTVCGSGNQGITASLPVVEYAETMHVSREKLIRAVAVSDLVAIYLKDGIGKLSAFCGALCAGIGAACGIAYLTGGSVDEISGTISNAAAVLSGMVCDGAKPSCAAKIAAAVDSGIFALELYRRGNRFNPGEGIISKNVDLTVRNVARLGKVGLRAADNEILQMMLQSDV